MAKKLRCHCPFLFGCSVAILISSTWYHFYFVSVLSGISSTWCLSSTRYLSTTWYQFHLVKVLLGIPTSPPHSPHTNAHPTPLLGTLIKIKDLISTLNLPPISPSKGARYLPTSSEHPPQEGESRLPEAHRACSQLRLCGAQPWL